MSNILIEKPARIKAERKRLGLTQAQASEICGIGRQQWIRYEKGTSNFDGEPLRKFGELGADINYILTGKLASEAQQKQSVTELNKTAEIERELILLFNTMSKQQQSVLIETARIFAGK